MRVRRGRAPRGVHTLLSGAWYLAVLAFLLVDLSGDLPRHPWSKPGAHPLRFNVSLSPLDTEPALAWLALPPTWHTGGFELLALAYTVVRLLGGLGMRRLFRGGLRPAKYLGRGTDMRSGLHAHSFVAYTSFWAVMLSVKFVFDYFAIVQPMVQVSARLCEALALAPALALAVTLTLTLSSTR